MPDELKPGLYERVVTEGLAHQLAALSKEFEAEVATLATPEGATKLARYFSEVLQRALVELEASESSLELQTQVVNGLLLHLEAEMKRQGHQGLLEPAPLVTGTLLRSLLRHDPLVAKQELPRPSFPLSESHLLVNSRHDRQIGHELALELASADRVDLLCSFLLWTGYQTLAHELRAFLSRPGARMRVITTVYMGATEQRVVDELHRLGAQVRVSYDTRRTRLHAKAWLVHRDTGEHTVFVGSSNLSAAALTDGLEWNVRMGRDAPRVLEKFSSAFEAYWNDPGFELYDPEADRSRLADALRAGKKGEFASQWTYDVRPFPYQEAILETLAAERFVHGRYRNLVVAATGTGKTVIAALDFKELTRTFILEHGRPPALLFLAHRRELLRQARDTFRAVLKDPQFGALYVDGERPGDSRQLFASVQSLAHVDSGTVPPSRWDIVIVDEFHHAEAPSYERWLAHLRPWVLLGLTATPERGDGRDVLHWFDGQTAIELRLWDAIEQGLLSPFQYHGLKDPIDTSSYWRRGKFDISALDQVLTGHHARAAEVLRLVEQTVPDPRKMRAIGFCVGQGHARFMADFFTRNGLNSDTALGDDPNREAKVRALQSGELQALFTVDALSEGVDVPEIDTALFLRPTESPTVFLQQLGRGLRLSPGKRCLTVLDFISTPSREFRLERKFLALVGGTRRGLEKQLEMAFPFLPAGCSIQLSEDAREEVLKSVRTAISARSSAIVETVRRLGSGVALGQLLEDTGLDLGDIYRNRTLTSLRRSAGFELPPQGAHEVEFGRGLGRLRTLDDPKLLLEVASDCEQATPPRASLEWKVVLSTLSPDTALADPERGLSDLWRCPALVTELRELMTYLHTRIEHVPIPFRDGTFTLQIHCHYKQEQIIAALTGGTRSSLTSSRAGVLYIEEHKFDVFFVTLNKSPDRYSPTTRYKDYPLSRELFHWQSMGNTRQQSVRGNRHLRHRELGVTPLLFVRADALDEFGDTAPYCFLGPVELESAEGERPINVVWRLTHLMPAALFEQARVVA